MKRTIVELIESLKDYVESKVSCFSLPVKVQKGDAEQSERAPNVYKMHLPDSRSYSKAAPYIIIQFTNGRDTQSSGEITTSSAHIRMIFCVYGADDESGSMSLLNVMERVRIALQEDVVIAGSFMLDKEKGIEYISYPEETSPYYAGELSAYFIIPEIERRVSFE